jgi:hypothetical protein
MVLREPSGVQLFFSVSHFLTATKLKRVLAFNVHVQFVPKVEA